MKTNDTIKVHLYDLHNKEIQTRNYGKTFCVYEKALKSKRRGYTSDRKRAAAELTIEIFRRICE